MDIVEEENKAALTEYLAKEVELHTNLLLAQRTKNNLMFCIAPFLILGVIATNAEIVSGIRLMSNSHFLWLLVLILISFLFLGYIGAAIEKKLWGQCNEWRRAIAKIHKLDGEEAFNFSSGGLNAVYFSIFGTVGLLFSVLLYLLKSSA